MVSVYLIIIVQIFAISVSGTALSATIPDDTEREHTLDISHTGNPLHYHLVTVPSINQKRVDTICIKFLSLIPKARLIPNISEGTVYRLIANRFDNLESAKKRKAELMKQNESAFIVKGNQGYTVIVASHLSTTLAVEEQNRLAGKHIATTILELRIPLKQWQMKSTESFTIRDAVFLANMLANMGVTTTIEPTAF